jgi:hypothetical protein
VPGAAQTQVRVASIGVPRSTADFEALEDSKYIERIGTLDRGAVCTAARKHLVPERMLVVAVGDRQKIEADLMKLNLGAIEVRDTEGNVVKP